MCGQQTRPSINFVDNTIDLPWQNFSSQVWNLGQSYRGKYHYFGDTRISLQHSRRKLSCQNQLYPFSRVDTTPACDRQTDRHMMTAYTALAYKVARWRIFVTICHCSKTWRHPQKRKYITYCNVARGVPSNGNGHCKKLREFWRSHHTFAR